MIKCIHRTFHGGAEFVSFDEFAHSVVQDEVLAVEIAQTMLRTQDSYEYNEDAEPQFFEKFSIPASNKAEVERQIEAFKASDPHWSV